MTPPVTLPPLVQTKLLNLLRLLPFNDGNKFAINDSSNIVIDSNSEPSTTATPDAQIDIINKTLTDLSNDNISVEDLREFKIKDADNKDTDIALFKKVVLKHYLYKNITKHGWEWTLNFVDNVANYPTNDVSNCVECVPIKDDSTFNTKSIVIDENKYKVDTSFNYCPKESTEFCLRDTIVKFKVRKADAVNNLSASNYIGDIIADSSNQSSPESNFVTFDVDPLNLLIDLAINKKINCRLDLILRAKNKFKEISYNVTDDLIDDNNVTSTSLLSYDPSEHDDRKYQNSEKLLNTYITGINNDCQLNTFKFFNGINDENWVYNNNTMKSLPIYYSTDADISNGKRTSPYYDPNAFMKLNTFTHFYNLYISKGSLSHSVSVETLLEETKSNPKELLKVFNKTDETFQQQLGKHYYLLAHINFGLSKVDLRTACFKCYIFIIFTCIIS